MEGSGAEEGPGGAAAGGDANSDATSKHVDTTGAGGCHGAEKRETERVSGQQENRAGESSGVGNREGGPEASVVAENPGGDRQGVGGEVQLPRGTDTPGVENLSQG